MQKEVFQMMPEVLNRYKIPDQKITEDMIYIGRPSQWGNPFVVGIHGDREECVKKHREWVLKQPDLIEKIKTDLKGKHLVCHCAPLACHGDIYLEIANQGESSQFSDRILRFTGDYRWLSNFYSIPVLYEGITYPSSEHAYQAAKTDDLAIRLHIANIDNPVSAKRYGRKISRNSQWEEIKIQVMSAIVLAKFNQNLELKQNLLGTGDKLLEEGNWHKDTFWGICPPASGIGHNHLGKILMDVRKRLRIV